MSSDAPSQVVTPSVQTVLEFWLDQRSRAFTKAAIVVAKAKAKLLIPCEEIDEVVSIISAIIRTSEGGAKVGCVRKTRIVARIYIFILFWIVGLSGWFGIWDDLNNYTMKEYFVFDFIFLLAIIAIGGISYKQICRHESFIMLHQANKVASMLSVWNKAKYLRFGFAFEEYSTKGLCLQAIAGGPSADFCPAKASMEVVRLRALSQNTSKKWKMLSLGPSTEPPPQMLKAKVNQGFDDTQIWEADEMRLKTGIRNSFNCEYAILLKYSTSFKRKPRSYDKDLVKSSLLSVRNRKDYANNLKTPMGSKRQLSENSQPHKLLPAKDLKIPIRKVSMERSEEIFIMSGGNEPWEYAVPSEELPSVRHHNSYAPSLSDRSLDHQKKPPASMLLACENLAIPEVSHHSDEDYSAMSENNVIQGPINSRQSIHSNQGRAFQEHCDVEEHLNKGVLQPRIDFTQSPTTGAHKVNRTIITTQLNASTTNMPGILLKAELVEDEGDWEAPADVEMGQKTKRVSNISRKSSKSMINNKEILVESPKHAPPGFFPLPIEVKGRLKERSRDCSVDSNDSKKIPGGKKSRERSLDSNHEELKSTTIVRVNSKDSSLNHFIKASSLKNLPKPLRLGDESGFNPENQLIRNNLPTSKLIDIEDFGDGEK
jgi:hypothetical protein